MSYALSTTESVARLASGRGEGKRYINTTGVVKYHAVCTDLDCGWEHYSSYTRGKTPGGSYRKAETRRNARRHAREKNHAVTLKRIEVIVP